MIWAETIILMHNLIKGPLRVEKRRFGKILRLHDQVVIELPVIGLVDEQEIMHKFVYKHLNDVIHRQFGRAVP